MKHWNSWQRSAIHEASHAVAARYLGADIVQVYIGTKGGLMDGKTIFNCPFRRSLDFTMMVTYAPAAVYFLLGIDDGHPPNEWAMTKPWGELCHDIFQIAEIIDRYFPASWAEAYRQLHTYTVDLFLRPDVWTALEHLMNRLVTQPELSGSEVMAVIDPHIPIRCPDGWRLQVLRHWD